MKKRLEEHEERSFAFAAQLTEFPDDHILKFEKIQKQVEAPSTLYESILKQLSGDWSKCRPNAYQIVSSVPGIEFEPRLYVGVDTADHFLNTLQEELNKYIIPLIEKDV